ncbi:MAG: family 43 glycosylhydrolase [Clostridia bacterium]|nr:family 43 glycosylhydrolase [Clostridia bacterium]
MNPIFNPYLPLSEYIPDGEPHVFGDRVYVYGSHDKEGGDFFCMLDYVTYSASVYDLTDWRYEGVIYRASQDPHYPAHRYMYAPDVVRGNDGRYYLYYSLADRKDCSFLMSVAVSDSPAGPFEFHGYVRYPDGRLLQDGVIFEPGLINDDGRVYLYYGVWYDFDEDPNLTREESIARQMEMYKKTREEIEQAEGGVMGPMVVELCDDMLTVKAGPKHIFPTVYRGSSFEEHPFFEASSMRKIGDTYYFIYSTYHQHELAYATSNRPDGGFVFGGVIVSNADIGYKGRKPEDRLNRTGNNHGSIEKINGEWYIFYHRQTHKNDYSRQACAEKIEILPDGSIPQVEITSCGLNGGPLAAKGTYPAVICCNLTNGHMPHGHCTDVTLPHIEYKGGERIVAEIEDGTTVGYKYFAYDGVRAVGVHYRDGAAPATGAFAIRVEDGGEVVARIPLSASADWRDAEAAVELSLPSAPLYLTYEGKGMAELLYIYFK